MKTLEPVTALSLKNILLATDFSPGSETAVKYAQAIARRHTSRVHTIHVNSPDSYNLLDPDAFAITFNGPEANSKMSRMCCMAFSRDCPARRHCGKARSGK